MKNILLRVAMSSTCQYDVQLYYIFPTVGSGKTARMMQAMKIEAESENWRSMLFCFLRRPEHGNSLDPPYKILAGRVRMQHLCL
jgi:hypothetical protein